MKDNKCPKCSSSEIMANVMVRDVADHGPYPLRVQVEEPEPPNRGFIWMPKTAKGDIRAWICRQCGFTELYTNNLEELYQIYKLSH